MVCQQVNSYTIDDDGKRNVVVDLLSSTVPGTMPSTGANITGLDPTDIIDVGSTLYIVNTGALYMMNEELEFKAQ